MPDHNEHETSAELTPSDYEKLGRQLSATLVSFGSRRKIMRFNFAIGVIRGFGTVLGATIGIAILIWLLTLFKQVPLVGPFVNNLKHTIQTTPTTR